MTEKNKQNEFMQGSQDKKQLRVGLSDVGPVTLGRNRRRTALSETYAEATNTVKWSESENIHEVTCLIMASATSIDAMREQSYNLVTINAGSEIMAAAMLTEVDSENSDAQLDLFKFGERFVIRSISPITRLDFKPVDVGATLSAIKLWVGAH